MTCKDCICYLTDEDENGNLTEFHHDKNADEGFCALRDLFYNIKANEKICNDFIYDKGVKIK